ncbi:MAG: AAA family ATPase [Candidatus Margulisbacteria bacterium]|jgi:ABC-type cobalamin/Fe3+-siderophores transport system ATPase subunit|nr:AAA family ATPase [Candidatus Margulisiibacteriota bacterium]
MIKFNKIENGEIFTRDFRPFVKNNEVDFPTTEEIAVIYGPNGTGKTSLIKVLSDEKGTKIEFVYDDQSHTSGKDIFHIINDQNNRNIIKGETKDFFLGDNIRREFELQEFITSERANIINEIISSLKSHGISAANSPLIDLISMPDIAALIKDIANSKSKGNKYTTEDLIAKLQTIVTVRVSEPDATKLQFLQNDIAGKDSIIRKIKDINANPLTSNPHVHQIEENTEAINILNRFHKNQCIVCDTTDIDWEVLLASKTANRTMVIETLNEDVKNLIEKIIGLIPAADPFQIKTHLINAISQGDNANIVALLEEIEAHKILYCQIILNDLATLLLASELPSKMTEYQTLIAEKPEITEEDMLYIEEIISNSMNKKLTLERDERKNLRIFLSNQAFLGKPRDELPLSTGEQNFLSLTFEFLKAKNSACPIVVIDDPISSFDSIYKNKVAYAIVKMLHHKKRIVLTHNTDLLRLLESQYKHCYKLYLLNNTDSEENGFIALNQNEQEMLISLEKLLSAFRNNIFSHIQNAELFLISMVPFMRGYANIINNTTVFNKLTQLMHGYKTDKVDVADIYKTLFGSNGGVLPNAYEVSVPDILAKTVDGVRILDPDQYPLLDKTLRHSFTYLFLRLLVEKKLVERFGINTNHSKQLGQIISAAYPDENNITQIRNRIRLTSKKTLINEFNHFEGNLSIFQPAIDITDQALGKERTDVVTFVNNL